MQVLVTFRHVEPSNALRDYAEQKVGRVGKYLPRARDAHVVLSVDKRRHRAEITVQARGGTLSAGGETSDLYAAIDLAVDKLSRQARKLGTKRKDRRSAGRVPAARPAAAEPARRRVVRTERMTVKPMTVEEALTELELAGDGFLLFRNAANEVLSVVYRRKGGGYGLIVPEVA